MKMVIILASNLVFRYGIINLQAFVVIDMEFAFFLALEQERGVKETSMTFISEITRFTFKIFLIFTIH